MPEGALELLLLDLLNLAEDLTDEEGLLELPGILYFEDASALTAQW